MRRDIRGTGRGTAPRAGRRWWARAADGCSCRRLAPALVTLDHIPQEIADAASLVAAVGRAAIEEPRGEDGEDDVRDAHRDERVDVAARGKGLAGAHQRVVDEEERQRDAEALRLAAAGGFESERYPEHREQDRGEGQRKLARHLGFGVKVGLAGRARIGDSLAQYAVAEFLGFARRDAEFLAGTNSQVVDVEARHVARIALLFDAEDRTVEKTQRDCLVALVGNDDAVVRDYRILLARIAGVGNHHALEGLVGGRDFIDIDDEAGEVAIEDFVLKSGG